ncbi:MAG: hypothetical protein HGA19_12180, partial [Oscillochloris sp.]|nr:hypothetical protein [Oscillochloris sp.]
MLPDQPQGDSLLERGAAALRVGNRDRARELLGAAVRADPQNILAWLWLSGALDNPAQQRQCLERVLRIDPQNMAALRGLELLCLENEGQALGERSQDLAAVQLPSVVFPPPPASGPRLPPPIIIVLLSILGGPGLILSWAARQRLGDQVTPGMLLAMALVAGPPLVLLGVVLLAVLLRMSGRIVGGRGTT